MKKIFAIVLAVAMLLCLAACGGGPNDTQLPSDESPAPSDSAAPSDSPAPSSGSPPFP